MHSYLLLPREFSLYLDRLSPDEFHALLPTDFEIKQLGVVDLTQQLVSNALAQYPNPIDMSPEVRRVVRSWMMINDDPRLGEITDGSKSSENIFWELVSHYIQHLSQSVPSLEDLGYDPDHDSSPQIYKDMIKEFELAINMVGDVEERLDFFERLLQDHRFVYNNLTQINIFARIISGHLTVAPGRGLPLIQSLIQLMKNQGLMYYAHHLQLIEGNIYATMGRYEQAYEIYEEVESYASKHNFRYLGSVRNNRGMILFFTGKWDEAISLYKELLEEDPNNATLLNNIAESYSRKGDMETAWTYAKQFLDHSDLRPFLGSYEFIQPIVFELQLDEEAHLLMDRMRKMAEISSSDMNVAFLKLMEARQARYETNLGLALQEINRAIELMMQLKVMTHIYLVLVEKINILLDLYEIKPTPVNRQHLFNAVNDVISLSDDQQVVVGSIEGLHLRSQIYLQFDEIQEAREDLYNASKLADQFEYHNLYQQLQQELDEISAVDQISEAESHSIFSNLKTKLRQLVGLGTNSTYESSDYTVHGSIVMSQTGIPVYTNYTTDKLKSDSALISGLISAVSAMLDEVSQSQGFLKTIQREDFSLLFEPIPHYLIVSIVDKETFEARQNLEKFATKTAQLLTKYDLEPYNGSIPPEFDSEMQETLQEFLT